MKYGREWCAGVFAGVIAGAIGGWIFTTIGGWLIATKLAHWWDVAGAVATFLAVVVALGNTWFAHRNERMTKYREGCLVAAQLSSSLPPLVWRLEDARDHFRRAKEGAHAGPWEQAGWVEEGLKLLRGIDVLIPNADLAALAWADGRAADELAKALGSVRQIVAHPLEPISEAQHLNGVEPSDYYLIAGHCTNAGRWLESVRQRCSKLSVVKFRIDDEWRLPNANIAGYPPPPNPQPLNNHNH